MVAVALSAACVAGATWAGTTQTIGPLDARLTVVPALSGGLEVAVPPLGNLRMQTHRGPLAVRAEVTRIRPDAARRLLASDRPDQELTDAVAADARDALQVAAASAALVALTGAGVACLVVFRRPSAALGGVGTTAAALAVAGLIAATTADSAALTEPRFEGLLANAPALVGGVRDLNAYNDRVTDLARNVTQVYDAGAPAAAAGPAFGGVRALWVADVHNNPQAFALMRTLVKQFDVQLIVDTGDITDLGSRLENRLLGQIETLGVPYLYVRGNHDSKGVTQRYLQRLRNVTVLDEASPVVEVAGIRWAGIGDPLFTPNKRPKADRERNAAALRQAGTALATAIDGGAPVDVVLVHEPQMAAPLVGSVPLVLAAHTHQRDGRFRDGTLELTQGSSGGAGLRAFDADEETASPLQMSVLHLSGAGTLLAVDDVTVGGLGDASVTVTRTTPSSYGDAPQLPDAVRSPDPGAS